MNASAPEPPPPAGARSAQPRSHFLILGIADAIFLVTLACLLALRQRLVGDGDTGWHIRVGDLILQTHTIPRHDPFSIITPPIPWTAHEWLAEILMACAHRIAGLTGVALLHAAVLAASIHQAFRLIRGRCENLFVAVGFTLLLLCGSLVHFLARPHAYTFLLLVIWMRVLDAYEHGASKRLLIWLPASMPLWVNLHGGAIIGLVLLGLTWLGSLGGRRERSLPLAFTLGASTLACLANPHGINILLFPFKVQSMRSLMSTVTEFMPPTISTAPVFVAMILLALILLGRSPLPLERGEILRLGVFGFMAFSSIRYTALFAFVVAPILARRADALLDRAAPGRVVKYLRSRAPVFQELDARSRQFFWPLAGIAIAVLMTARGSIPTDFDRETAPLAAIDHMNRHRLAGNGFNSDEFGDFLIYAANPPYRVFIDGRLDMYGELWHRTYLDVLQFKPESKITFDRYDIRWILYDTDSTFTRVLRTRIDWRVAYEDKVATLFVRVP